MNKKDSLKMLGALLLAGFSFFYTTKISEFIKENDPVWERINDVKDDYMVMKVDPIIMNDEYITGINGCIVDEKNSYSKMKNVGEYKEELLVMKEDEVEKVNKFIIGGNKKKRNVSIILFNTDDKLNKFIEDKEIVLNLFLDSNYVSDNLLYLKKLKNYNIYNYGRNNRYESKYIVYDNALINNNFNNKSNYCLVLKKDMDTLNLCNLYKMDVIKGEVINDNLLSYTKQNLKNGNIFIIDNTDYDEIKMMINYILSKGYNIVSIEELVSSKNTCE